VGVANAEADAGAETAAVQSESTSSRLRGSLTEVPDPEAEPFSCSGVEIPTEAQSISAETWSSSAAEPPIVTAVQPSSFTVFVLPALHLSSERIASPSILQTQKLCNKISDTHH